MYVRQRESSRAIRNIRLCPIWTKGKTCFSACSWFVHSVETVQPVPVQTHSYNPFLYLIISCCPRINKPVPLLGGVLPPNGGGWVVVVKGWGWVGLGGWGLGCGVWVGGVWVGWDGVWGKGGWVGLQGGLGLGGLGGVGWGWVVNQKTLAPRSLRLINPPPSTETDSTGRSRAGQEGSPK